MNKLSFYNKNLYALPHLPKFNKQGLCKSLKDLQCKFVIVPADTADNNMPSVLCSNDFTRTFTNYRYIIFNNNRQPNEIIADHIAECKNLNVKENITNEKLPSLYWIPKLHKTPH